MEKVAIGFGVVAMSLGGIFMFVIFGTLLGGVAGWIVGLFFADTILGIASQLGIKNVTMFQLGAFMGFFGGFLKTKVTAEVKPANQAMDRQLGSDTSSVAGTEREALEETLHDRAYDAVKAIREHNGWTQVREFVEFYFSPWGAAKGALWEAITGDQPFNAEVAMQHIKGLLDGKSENPAQLAKDGGK